MQNVISREKVMTELRAAVADTLRLDETAVEPGRSLVLDLAAESLDFLDINYRMEQAFGIKMARHFVLEHAEEIFGEGTMVDDLGRLTQRGVSLLRRRYGEVAISDEMVGVDMGEVPALITVDAIADTVMDLLATLPQECKCGATGWSTADGTHIVCSACGEPAEFVDGDRQIQTWLRAVETEDPSS
jgi:acyl carrier protein